MKISSFQTIGQKFNPQQNSFGFIRLLLACGVIVSHAWDIGGFGREPFRNFSQDKYTLGRLCVFAFFSISGFLVAKSYDLSTSTTVFIWRRFLRIFPAYWLWLIIAIVVYVPLFCWLEYRPVDEFFRQNWQAILSYFAQNATLKIFQWGIPPLLSMTPVRISFNSSLWSLWVEWQCYLLLVVTGFVSKPHVGKLLLIVGFPITWYLGFLNPATPVEAFNCMPYFFAGAAIYYLRNKIRISPISLIFSTILLTSALYFDKMPALGPLSMTYTMICLAVYLPKKLSWFDHGRDISYGTYIYGFPMQQALTLLGVQKLGIIIYILGSLIAALCAGFLSWQIIEKPALKLKSWKMMK